MRDPVSSDRSRRRHHNPFTLARAVETLEPRRLLAAAGFEDLIASAITRASDLSQYSKTELRDAREWAVSVNGVNDLARFRHDLGAQTFAPSGLIGNIFVATFPASRSGVSVARAVETFVPDRIGWPIIARQQTPRFIPNDPQFAQQQHLLNTGQSGGLVGADANIVDAWDNYTGNGVVIGIVDDGVTPTHQDLAPSYVAAYSWDFNNNDPDPSGGSHGTSVAGVAGAKGNNGIGVTGAAFNAQHAGLRLIAGPSTDTMEAAALAYMKQNIDIYNNSWGPSDSGNVLAGPGPLTLAAFADALENGRGGLGNIYVWAGGNGGNNDNVNFDGYANHRGIIAVAAVTNTGVRSSYSERGAPLLVAAYSNGGTRGITTTSSSGYTSSFGGTSSASPLAAGVIALMLEANPTLTWRDVQHILVNSAEKIDATNSDWTVNGAGHDVNHFYGFGGIDATAATNLAANWVNVAPETSATTGTINVNLPIPNINPTGVSHQVAVTDAIKLETVEVVFNATHTARGQLSILLTSPSGTESVLATTRTDTGDHFNNWVFSTKRHWDEDARGTWTIRVIDNSGADTGTFNSYKLNFYGTNLATTPTIYGTVYDDTNANGQRDAGEPGIPNITVWVDENGDGVLDPTEPSVLTNGVGAYSIPDLVLGQHEVRSIAPSGQRPSQPAGGGPVIVTLTSGQNFSTGNNFGFVNPRFAGVVYNDANDNGTQDTGEIGIAGVVVYLDLDNSGDLSAGDISTTTDANGAYVLGGLTDGSYTVRVVNPSGHRLTAPSAAAHSATISNTNLLALGRNFGLTTTARLVGAVYSDSNANGTRDPGEPGIAGARVYIDVNNNGTFDNLGGDFASTNVPLLIPPGAPTSTSGLTTSTMLVSGALGPVQDLTVTLNITHTYNGDLVITLVSPAGTRVILSNRRGGSGDNFTNTVFSDAAATPISAGTAPFAGTYRPDQPLSALNGQNANGTWTLEVNDAAGGDWGTLHAWSISYGGVEPNFETAADGNFTFPGLPAGTYHLRQLPIAGAVLTEPVSGVHSVTAGPAAVIEQNFGNSTQLSSSTGFYVRLNGAGDTIQVFRNTDGAGSPDFNFPVGVPDLNLVGDGGNDTLVVDLVNGSPIPAGGINFDGGAGDDTVVLRGSDGDDSVILNGNALSLFGGGGSITATDVETLRFEGGDGNDTLNFQGSPIESQFLGEGGRNLLMVTGGTWTYDADAATQNDQIDVDVFNGATIQFNASQRLDSMRLRVNADANLAPGGRFIRTGLLNLAATSRLDLSDGGLIVDYEGASPLGGIVPLLTSGYAGGNWNGVGIRSLLAGASSASDGIGYAEASDLFTSFPGSFFGQSVDDTTVLLRYTLNGDANLDGSVGIGDFSTLGANFNTTGGWSRGDFNYDQAIGIADFSLLASNFNQSAPASARATPGLSPFGSTRIGDGDERRESLTAGVLGGDPV